MALFQFLSRVNNLFPNNYRAWFAATGVGIIAYTLGSGIVSFVSPGDLEEEEGEFMEVGVEGEGEIGEEEHSH